MAGIGGVVINFAARTAEAIRDVDNFTRSLGKADDKADTLGGRLKKGVAVGAAAVGAAMLTGGAALIEFGKAAAEDEAQAENLRRTLEKIPGVTDAAIASNEAWIDSMEIATTVADTDLRNAVSKLTLATGDLTTAQELTAVAVDTAAGSGKSLKGVTEALAKAAQGNTAALERQFPWLDKNKDGTVTLDEALRGLKTAYGGAAEAAADKKPWERFHTLMDQLQETIGEKLLPYFDRFSDWLKNKENQKKLTDFVDDVLAVADAVGGLVKIVWNLVGALKAAWEWLDNATKKVDRFYDAVNNMVTWPWEPGGRWPWQGNGRSMSAAGTSASRSAGAAVSYSTAPVVLTDEMVYRALGQLLTRGDTRNGRTTMAVP